MRRKNGTGIRPAVSFQQVTAEDVDGLRRFVEKAFSIPFDSLPIPQVPLYRIDHLLVGSVEAAAGPRLVEADIWDEPLPAGYSMVGYWGHGVNSYAFYYVRADSQSQVVFRLPYGGGYSNNTEDARRIAAFLPAYFAFERKLRDAGCHITAIDSMGTGAYRIRMPDGKLVEHARTMIRDPDFEGVFASVMTCRNLTREAGGTNGTAATPIRNR